MHHWRAPHIMQASSHTNTCVHECSVLVLYSTAVRSLQVLCSCKADGFVRCTCLIHESAAIAWNTKTQKAATHVHGCLLNAWLPNQPSQTRSTDKQCKQLAWPPCQPAAQMILQMKYAGPVRAHMLGFDRSQPKWPRRQSSGGVSSRVHHSFMLMLHANWDVCSKREVKRSSRPQQSNAQSPRDKLIACRLHGTANEYQMVPCSQDCAAGSPSGDCPPSSGLKQGSSSELSSQSPNCRCLWKIQHSATASLSLIF